jgi:hypothetical protein
VSYERFVAGYPSTPKRNKYIEADERILSIVTRYDRNILTPIQNNDNIQNDPLITYLRGLSQNYRM